MKIPAKFLTKSLFSSLDIANKLCKPPLNDTKDYLQQEITYERNKIVINLYLAVIIVLILQLITSKFTLIVAAITLTLMVLQIVGLVISCHYNMNIFRFWFSITMSSLGPAIMFINAESGQKAWLSSLVYPSLVLLCTGSVHHFLFQAGLQLILINFVYQSQMLHYLDFTPPEVFLSSLTRNLSTTALLNVAIIACIDLTIKKAYDKMQAAEKKKEEFERQKIFLLGFSHELRNIINSLMGNVKLASLENLSEKTRNFLRNADVCAESLLHLINNILDSGKVEIGELEINLAPTNIYNTMNQIWSVFSEQIKRKSLHGDMRFVNNIPEILQVDHYRLMQIFFNLIGNAVKFTETGFINIKLEWIPNTDCVTEKNFEPYPFNDDDEEDLSKGVIGKRQQYLTKLGGRDPTFTASPGRPKRKRIEQQHDPQIGKGLLKVIVADTGNGIAKEDVTKLFQKFSQVSADPSKRKLGTGLGLFITKQLCERMGGKIKVFSKEGKGSSFIFCIPVTSLPSDSLTRTIIHNNSQKKKLRALVVDDEILGRNILESFFCKLQVEVVSTAQNGFEAYNTYVELSNRGQTPDLVTMDLTMPVMDGKTAAEKLRKFEKENGIEPCLLIIVSGNCSESEITECTVGNGEIRANFFLKKPARMDELNRVITQFKKEKHKREIMS